MPPIASSDRLPAGGLMWISLAVVALVLVGGLFYFKRMERVFADVV